MVMRTVLLAGLIVSAGSALLPAQRGGTRVTTEATCAANLGAGLESRRTFCDVIIGANGADSVLMTVPPHTGTATLLLDLHNRFTIPGPASPPVLAFARHEAIVAVTTPTGDVLGRAAVVREFRTTDDLFDRIGGGGPGGIKAVAPGRPEAARFTIPADVDTIGIVGSRLTVLTRAAGSQTFDTPGRPVAMVSNLRIQYRP
jgi:hypothetical protein